jgi:predicted TIM-barrel fold metal-dependent hydrolase
MLAPIFDELNRRNAIVFVHPTGAACCSSIIPGLSSATEEYLFNTTRAITSLLVGGTFSRCPNIRFIFTHCGGTMPMVADRVARNLAGRADLVARFPKGALYELQRQFYDVTTSTSAPTLGALMRFALPTNILFGSDYPYVAMGVTVDGLAQANLDAATLARIHRDNAAALIKRRS